jgi:signal transduction histidine kinase
MKLATRITAGNLTLVAILLGLAGYFLRGLEELREPLLATTERVPSLSRTAAELDTRLERLSDLLLKVPADEDYEGRAEELGRELDTALEALRIDVRQTPLPADKAIEFGETVQELFGVWREFQKAAQFPAEVPTDERQREANLDAWGLRLRAKAALVREHLAQVDAIAAAVAQNEPQKRIQQAQQRATRSSLWAAAVALVLALAVALGVLGAATRPLERLARGARAIASGDLSFRVTPEGSPEVRGLARDFNAMADRLHELNRLKSDFVSSVSHDLKAPLASIAETTSLLLDGLPGPLTEKQSRLLALNLESSRRLGQMIENLLDLSRIETGALALQFLRHDLVVLAGQVVDQLRGLIDKKGLAVAIEGAAGTAVVECDAASIRRALGNLVANAVTFSPAGGRIDIRVQPRAKESVEVLVADQGPGVPDAEKERIFQRFYRSEHGARGPGTGIGLAIARAVLEAHGGVLWVRDGPSGGSVFSCLLPRSRRAPREALA